MRVFFLFVSISLLCAIAFSDHHEKHNGNEDKEHGGHKKVHHHSDEKHDHRDHHHSNESMPCLKIAPYNAHFSFSLYRKIAADNPTENIFLSPVSISTAFAMLSLGARGQTLKQITEGLSFNTTEISEEEIHKGFQHLLHMLNDPNSEMQLNSGNALFIDKDFQIIQKFVEDAKQFYEAEPVSTDFHNTEEATKQINSYAEKKTNGKITELLSTVDEKTLLVLINYIYFRGQWEKPFEKENTADGEFHVDKDTVVTVPMMHKNGMYNVAYDDQLGCTVVLMPYKGNATALFILPDEGKLRQVEEALETPVVKSWRKIFRRRSVNLTLPKFSISATLDLVKELTKLGVTDVFSDGSNLSGITEAPPLRVSKAVHKALLSIDETGTEAAGVTGMELMPMMVPSRIEFNKPFLIIIYGQETRSNYFMGRIMNPKK
ncbi:hypothetical protein XELAEV_18039575mg [Xenopus laevis]|uniref:Serpin domain-containing protein n=1 Tax=Xenopus laevis TaxID=8355 RepID=A0A974C8C0_XENLA|nr:hypothetical protein XELAEV_18039575mg [Xenopus laevis]